MAVKKPGQIVVFRFPQTNLNEGKLRPASPDSQPQEETWVEIKKMDCG